MTNGIRQAVRYTQLVIQRRALLHRREVRRSITDGIRQAVQHGMTKPHEMTSFILASLIGDGFLVTRRTSPRPRRCRYPRCHRPPADWWTMCLGHYSAGRRRETR